MFSLLSFVFEFTLRGFTSWIIPTVVLCLLMSTPITKRKQSKTSQARTNTSIHACKKKCKKSFCQHALKTFKAKSSPKSKACKPCTKPKPKAYAKPVQTMQGNPVLGKPKEARKARTVPKACPKPCKARTSSMQARKSCPKPCKPSIKTISHAMHARTRVRDTVESEMLVSYARVRDNTKNYSENMTRKTG